MCEWAFCVIVVNSLHTHTHQRLADCVQLNFFLVETRRRVCKLPPLKRVVTRQPRSNSIIRSQSSQKRSMYLGNNSNNSNNRVKERFHNERTERKFWKFFWTIAVVVSSFGRMFEMGRLVIYGLFFSFLLLLLLFEAKLPAGHTKPTMMMTPNSFFSFFIFFPLELFILFSIKTVCVVQSWGVESAWAAAC